jgi:hypothetical protein
MKSKSVLVSLTGVALAFAMVATAGASEEYQLLIGLNHGLTPGAPRAVFPSPGPGFPGTFADGDRLTGTANAGVPVSWLGDGTPFFETNQFGSLSFMYRRGSIPAGPAGRIPLMGIDYLGGPLLDLDGDLNNATRSLVPVPGQSPVIIPGTTSFVDLSLDKTGGTIQLNRLDATATNEGGAGLSPGFGVTVNTIAGTTPLGGQTGPINPSIDTRVGTLSPHTGVSGTLNGVWRIEGLGYEFWQDSIAESSSTADTLGTFQFLGTFRGWVIERDGSGQFPTLAGEGLGSTLWPLVDTSQIGNTFNTTFPPVPTATIASGVTGDDFTVAGNGGQALSDFGGDLGAYLDAVVLPLVDPLSMRVVFVESAGFGINNSFDPVFPDSVGYDIVLIAQSTPIPEPITLWLLLGGAAILRRRGGKRGRHRAD